MANFNKPDNTSLKADVLTELKDRDTDIALMRKPTSNTPEGYVAFDSGLNKFVKWVGGVWSDLFTTLAANISGNAATATKLSTARAINGVDFDGSADISVKPYINNDETTNATRYLVFTDSNTPGHKDLSTDGGVSYNPSTNTAAVNISGNAATATNATTQPVGTSNTTIATTAFVQTEIANDAPTKTGGGASGTWGISITGNAGTATNLQPDANVTRLNATGTGNSFGECGVELYGDGSANTVKPSLGFHQPSLFAGTLQQSDATNFKFLTQFGSLANLEIAAGTTTNHAVNFGQFINTNVSLAANGFQRLPGGLLIQWGTSSATNGAVNTFPLSFPNAVLSIVGTPTTGNNSMVGLYIYEVTTTSFKKITAFDEGNPADYSVRYIAIGC